MGASNSQRNPNHGGGISSQSNARGLVTRSSHDGSCDAAVQATDAFITSATLDSCTTAVKNSQAKPAKTSSSNRATLSKPSSVCRKGGDFCNVQNTVFDDIKHSRWMIAGYIEAAEEGIDDDDDDPVEQVGMSCQICELDLAFTPDSYEPSQSLILPTVVVLSCGHCYHACCIDSISTAEPSCIICFSTIS
ncbi:hypothetical protein AXF42_Ash010888 [Apostasia shenzhenica]|uniref:RING-type domain-containing protein n=1 Tax=Apostasia shenzhenica TaxID=1088818 RepID=A0A2I0A0Y0_9ASPA|nr:hypothetical protein AXF42_Ash010888 [Apostasia shenzhenica]